jgi:hypothetical protein
MPYIEIKTNKQINLALARKVINKGGVSAILTTGKITQPAKELFDEHDVAYAENVSERTFRGTEAQEEG